MKNLKVFIIQKLAKLFGVEQKNSVNKKQKKKLKDDIIKNISFSQ